MILTSSESGKVPVGRNIPMPQEALESANPRFQIPGQRGVGGDQVCTTTRPGDDGSGEFVKG